MSKLIPTSVSALAVAAVMALATSPALAETQATVPSPSGLAPHTAMIDANGVITFGGADIGDFVSPGAMQAVDSPPAGNSCSNTNCGCRQK